MSLKKFFRWLSLTIFAYALVIALLLLANTLVFSLVSSNPERMKAIIADSGAYQRIPEVIFDSIKKEGQQQNPEMTNNTEASIENPDVKKAALEVFSPEFFKRNFESGLDGIYAWLEGKTNQPKFTVDLATPKQELVNRSVDYRINTIQSLPACDKKQSGADIDIFNFNCKPSFALNADQIKQQVKQELEKNDDFLGQNTFTATDIKDKNGKPLHESAPNLPEQFQAAKMLPLALLVMAILLSVSIIFINETRRKGALSLARIFIVAGVLLLLAPMGISFVSNTLLGSSGNNEAPTDIIKPLVSEFNSVTASIYYWVGAITILVGIIGLLAYSGKLGFVKRLRK